jgi:hypothetical protein
MAILNQIGGISTGGLTGVVQGPLNALFKTKSSLTNYQYPLNLSNDPSAMHIVKFTIRNIIPRHFDVKKTFESAKDTTKSQLEQTVKAATGLVQNIQANLQPERSKNAATISLYMPDTLSMNYSQQYETLSLGEATNQMSRLAGAVGSFAEGAMNGNLADAFLNAVNEFGPEVGLRAIDSTKGTNITDIGLAAMGQAVNPQLQLIYRGVGLRTFTMEFMFAPKSKEESDQVTAVINAFIYASSPDVSGSGGMYFTPPSIFKIDFLMAETGNLSAMASMLQKAGNSIIPGVPLGNALAGGASKGKENNRLYKVGDCVLTDVSVDYAPNGWAAHENGAPVQTRLNLSFQELNILDRGRLRGDKAR